MDFLLELLRSPEAQADAYTWGAVLLGHAAIGAFLVAAVAWLAGAWRSAIAISIGYLVGWEGGQVLLHGGTVADGLVDAAALASGAFVAAGLWVRRLAVVAAALLLLSTIGIRGVGKRK